MKNRVKKALSIVLSISMVISLFPGYVFADENAGSDSGQAYFEFAASEYEVGEGDGEFEIKVLRHGAGTDEADITFKIADLLASYGEDYEVLDENGNPFEKVYGKKPQASDFKYQGESEQLVNFENKNEAPENTDENKQPESAGEEIQNQNATESTPSETETKGEAKSTGSSLLDAQAAYLGLSQPTANKQEASNVKKTLDDMYSYFITAEGTRGTVHFKEGQTEAKIRVRVFDNGVSEQSKLFVAALMDTDSTDTKIAPNATTYVTIVDDEKTQRAQFDLIDTGLNLTPSLPSGEVSIKRSGGTQYFATVYVSTVMQTADTDSYERFEYRPVAFVPGETEKKVEVTATKFDKAGQFGVRLEAESTSDVGNHYVTVNIVPQASVAEANMLSPDFDISSIGDIDSHIRNEGIFTAVGTLGVANENWGIKIPGGWKKDVQGDGSAWTSDNDTKLHVKQYDSGKYTMYVSNEKQELAGVKNIEAHLGVTNVSRGYSTNYNNYETYFETDSDQLFRGNLDGHSKIGNCDEDINVELSSTGESAYLKFATKACAGGWHNPHADLSSIVYNYAKYNFNPQNSAQDFSRKVFDFTTGKPNEYQTFYDGETGRVYNPGSVSVKNGGNSVNAFYANNDKTVVITPIEEANLKNKGLYFKGVYFAKGGFNKNDVYNQGKYTRKNVYYMEATGGKVSVVPDHEFVKKLYKAGVIKNLHSDANIEIFPVFEQEYVSVYFKNTDNVSAGVLKYDKNNKGSYFINVLEGFDANKLQLAHRSKNTYVGRYPKYSIMRVKVQPISTKMSKGTAVYVNSTGETKVSYHKQGEKIASGTVSDGESIAVTDYSKADIVANTDLTLTPVTADQTFNVAYFKPEMESLPAVFKGENGLTNAVVPSSAISQGQVNQGTVGTDKDGTYKYPNPYIGMKWSLTALAPTGYYTQWVNMTGDDDLNGYITAQEVANIRNKSESMPDEVYGNKISGRLDQDNFRLNYYFLPKTSGGNTKKTGRVVRASENFYQLANHIKSQKSDIPVSGAWVDIGGFLGQTNANGRYEIACSDLPSAGNVSTTITTDGETYNTVSKLQRDTHIKFDALSKFKVTGLSAYYDKTKGAIVDDFITVNDDFLNIEARVTSESAILPIDAEFFIYDENGLQKEALKGKPEYTTNVVTNGNELRATLRFNPTGAMQRGYKIYVRFNDQNGEWTNKIDLGYYFMSKLNLKEFVFPLIGSKSLEEGFTNGIVLDLIGEAMSGIDVGTLKGFEETASSYTPPKIPEKDRQAYTWQKNSYSFGWSKKFGDTTQKTSESTYEDKMAKYLKSIYDGTSKGAPPPQPGKYNTKSSFSWSVTPNVGFNLTLSARKDGNMYFEDVIFFVKVDFNVGASQQIQLPIGIAIIFKASLDGDVAGIYHMYVDYSDYYETQDAVPYTSENFGLFKKFNNSVRREGYIFLNPKVTVGLGIGYGIVFVNGNVSFDFDMDFQFTQTDTKAYGDVTIRGGWSIQVFNFEVYKKDYGITTQKMFSKDADGHIDFAYDTSLVSSLPVADFFTAGDDAALTLDKPTSRNYLTNMNDRPDDGGNTAILNAAKGTTESVIVEKATNSPYAKLAEIGNGKILMVFVGDDTTRTNINKRAVYYAIYSDNEWSPPQLLDNDQTLDDYPNISDLGDGKLLVTWSSADEGLENGATVEDAAKSMNIKARFFDKSNQNFGETMKVTKTTDGDYSADTMASAAYHDGKLILYYTKTEYKNMKKMGDLQSASSANAYMFYDGTKWSDADSYTSEEQEAITASGKNLDKYKEDWYGQRFLDIRTNRAQQKNPRVIDTTAIDYNGLALFAWTTDYDGNLKTLHDRDVYMQIYNFNANEFTHIIRVTPKAAAYSAPKFARSNNATYLFFGETKPQDGTGQNVKLEEHGSINYLNVSELVKNQRYTENTENGNLYYDFKYNRQDYTTPAGGEIATAQPMVATACDNPMDYDVKVAPDGKMYLIWTELTNGARQIVASIYNATDDPDAEGENAPLNEQTWSEPVVITAAPDGEYYSGIGATAVDGKIFVVGAKGRYENENAASLYCEVHTPFAKVKPTELTVLSEEPTPGSTVVLRAKVTNEGLQQHKGRVPVTFKMNAADIDIVSITKTIPGGSSIDVECEATLPENIANVEFEVCIGADKATTKIQEKSSAVITGSKIAGDTNEGLSSDKIVYKGVLQNTGTVDISNVLVVAKVKKTEAGKETIQKLEVNERRELEIELKIPDDAYAIGESGLGTAPVEVSVVENGETLSEYTLVAQKLFSIDAIKALSDVSGVQFERTVYYANANDKLDLQPQIQSPNAQDLTVMWQTSSDEKVAYVDENNKIVANGNGVATLTGIVVPNVENIDISGTKAQQAAWESKIPANKRINVSTIVNVGGSGGKSSSSSQGSQVAPAPQQPKGEVVTTAATVSGSTATATVSTSSVQEAIKKDKDIAKNGININVTGTANATNAVITISKEAVNAMTEAKAADVRINTAALNVSLNAEAMNEIAKSAKDDVKLAINKVESAKLPENTKKIVGTRPIFDLTITAGNEKISKFGRGKATVVIPYALKTGEEAEKLTVYYIDDSGNASEVAGAKYDATAKAWTFDTTHFSMYAVGEKIASKFTDIGGHWAKTYIDYVEFKGFMNGVSDVIFAPNTVMTRGMFVTVIGRMANVDTKAYTANKFADVKADMYYAPYIAWAVEKGIVKGMSDESFAPDANVTREQMAIMMAGYAKSQNIELKEKVTKQAFSDEEKIAAWSKESVSIMQKAGILNGKENNNFDPQGNATRAEVAKVIYGLSQTAM